MYITLETYSFKFTSQETAQGMPEAWNRLTEVVTKVMDRNLPVTDHRYDQKVSEARAKHKAVFDKKVRSRATDAEIAGETEKKIKKYALVGGTLIGLSLAAYKIAQKVKDKKSETIKKKFDRLKELEAKQKESHLTKSEIMELVSISRYLIKVGAKLDKESMDNLVSSTVSRLS